MCPSRHVLARVYLFPDERRMLARPEFRMLDGELFEGIAESNLAESIFVPWLYDLDQDHETIYFRCECHSYSAKLADLAAQLNRLPGDDQWLIVGASFPPGHHDTPR